MSLNSEETKEEYRKLFLENSKIVGPCPQCGESWRIPNYERRPSKKLISRKCPNCNPLGIRVIKTVEKQ